MIRMSNESKKKNTTRLVIIAVVIVAIIAGAFGYQMMTATSTTTAMMTSATSAPLAIMTSATMTSAMMTSSTMTSASQPPQPVSLLGAGATFPQPLIQQWAVSYNKLNPSVTINYNGIGSGGGIQQITAKTVDFGASDAPLSDAQLSNATGLVLMPETLGGVAITYNLATYGISNNTVLHFTGDVLAGIYMGQSPGGTIQRSKPSTQV